MEELKNVVDAKVYQKLLDANIDTLQNILLSPLNELHHLTNLPPEQLQQIKRKASQIIMNTNKFTTADQVPPWDRFSTGCTSIDSIIRGGIPINGITEIFGCSGVGKTQFCLQLALMIQLPANLGGKGKEAVYICTEDVFPSKRFHQLAHVFKDKHQLPQLDFENRVYIKHAADFEQLRRCLCVQLPRLLRLKNIGLIVIDSIAGIFRGDNDVCYTGRGQDIGVIASTLHNICDQHKIAIVCSNQVTENIETRETVPCLGLAWNNYVTCSFSISRYQHRESREFEVLFAPDLANKRCNFAITQQGVTVID